MGNKEMLALLKECTKKPKKLIKNITSEDVARTFLVAADSAYAKGKPIIPDQTYDTVRKHIDETYPDLSVKIGHKLDDDNVKLPVPMASLDQLWRDTDKLHKALKSKDPLGMSDKLDGQSVEIVYRNHLPVEAYTRGDALEGKDISHHLPYMNIPRRLESVKNVTIRTEAIIPLKDFNENLHERVGGKYKAARNCVCGLTRNFKPMPDEFAFVHFIAFAIIGGKYSNLTRFKQYKKLKEMGFRIPHKTKPRTGWTQDELIEHYEERMRKSKYELDGIVCTYDIVPDVPTENNPKEAFKYKMNSEAEAVIVKVKEVVWQISKYGVYTPVFLFDPTPMAGGVEVQRANGHNAWYVINGELAVNDKKGVPIPCKNPRPIGVGAKIKIVRSGKVIPYVVEVIKPSKKPSYPESNYRLEGIEAYVVEETDETKVRLLESFFDFMEFKDQGESTAKLLVAAGYSTIEKIYGIKKDVAEALIKRAKGASLIKSVKASKSETNALLWYTAVAPYYMKGSAKLTFQKVIDEVPDICKIGENAEATLATQISKIRGIKTLAPDLASTIIKANTLAIELDVNLIVPVFEQTSDKLQGLIAAFSGIRDKQLKEEILEAGGAASDSLTNATTVLIVKDTGASSSKIVTASKRGIPILTPAQFRAQYLET